MLGIEALRLLLLESVREGQHGVGHCFEHLGIFLVSGPALLAVRRCIVCIPFVSASWHFLHGIGLEQ